MPAARPIPASLVLVAALVAGCSGAEGGPPAGATSGPEGSAGLQPPVLEIGDWWTFTIPGGTSTLVVSGETSSDYIFDTDNPTIAWFDARNDISNLGPQRKSDLAGSQGDDRVEYLQWPLTGGKNWTTTWDGEPVRVEAHDVGDGKFHLMVTRENGTSFADLVYDNATRWFTSLDFKDAGGESAFKMTLTDSGRGFAGDLIRWSYVTHVAASGDLASVPPTVNTYEVPTTATDVYVDVELHCTQGFAAAGTAPVPFVGSLVGTDDRGAGNPGGPCPINESFHGVAGEVGAATAGMAGELWGFDLIGGAGTVGTVDFAIYIRTATMFKAGEAPS